MEINRMRKFQLQELFDILDTNYSISKTIFLVDVESGQTKEFIINDFKVYLESKEAET